MEEPAWKQIKLSLERPYKDDNGEPIPVLSDISRDGQHIYEPKVNQTKVLGENLRRIFVERGVDFFDKTPSLSDVEHEDYLVARVVDKSDAINDDSQSGEYMTAEELHKMRLEILPQLFVSLGEMSHARDLLVSLLNPSTPEGTAVSGSSNLSASIVTKPPPIVSVHAFDAQLTIGCKDEALRKAANVFKTAAFSMERTRVRDEKYWVDALRVRKGNWGLIPAPLPFGTVIGKGTDKTSKDFLVSYGLEESAVAFCRQSVCLFSSQDTSNSLTFPHRRNAQLRVSMTATRANGSLLVSHNRRGESDTASLEGALRDAQKEIVEREIFSLLVQEAGNLATASCRVSERLIAIEAADNIELRFEMVDMESIPPAPSSYILHEETCNMIYLVLHALLLRRHAFSKVRRLGSGFQNVSSSELTRSPPILRPIIDLLQYQVFCCRVKAEINQAVTGLSAVGVSSKVCFITVGETGDQLVQMLASNPIATKSIGGQVVLRIDERHIIHLTFISPSSLTAHLSQATLTISSLPQLCQLLFDEVERCLLQKICGLGAKLCEHVGGTWFVDLNRCVGRWEGGALNFRILYKNQFSIDCSAFQLNRMTPKNGKIDLYSTDTRNLPLLSWVEDVIKRTT